MLKEGHGLHPQAGDETGAGVRGPVRAWSRRTREQNHAAGIYVVDRPASRVLYGRDFPPLVDVVGRHTSTAPNASRCILRLSYAIRW